MKLVGLFDLPDQNNSFKSPMVACSSEHLLCSPKSPPDVPPNGAQSIHSLSFELSAREKISESSRKDSSVSRNLLSACGPLFITVEARRVDVASSFFF